MQDMSIQYLQYKQKLLIYSNLTDFYVRLVPRFCGNESESIF
jgi:hypothetical protein